MVAYRPSKQYKQLNSLKKQVIYKDDLFTFTTDDLYISNSNHGCVYLDISKYFNIYHLKLSAYNKKPSTNDNIGNQIIITNANANKLKFIQNRFIFLGQIFIIPDKPIAASSLFYLSEYHTEYDMPTFHSIIPGDVAADFTPPQSLFRPCDTLSYIDMFQTRALERFRVTDRKKRSSHNSPSIPKYFHKITKQVKGLNYDEATAFETHYRMAQIAYNKHFARVYHSVYKKPKSFCTLHNLPLVNRPLDSLLDQLFSILENHSYQDEVYTAGNEIGRHRFSYKKKYRFVRFLYILIYLKKYDNAVNLLMNIANQLRMHQQSSKQTLRQSSQKYVNVHLSKQAIEYYKRKFDLFYYQLASLTYSNLNDKPAYMSNNKITDNSTNVYINSLILNKIKSVVYNTFNNYSKLYHLIKNQADKSTYTYAYYYYPSYDMTSQSPVGNKKLSEFIRIKQKNIQKI